jgi:hypothetical protein
MSFDDLQSKWQSHDHGTQLPVDTDQLLKEVQRKHRALQSSLLWRDIGEVFAAVIVTIVFGVMAVKLNEWTLWLCSFGGLFVGMYFVVDRWIQSRRHPRPTADDSLQTYIQALLVQVDHQIWLLKNIFWWYEFPIMAGLAAFLGSVGWRTRSGGPAGLILMASVGLVCVLAFWRVYVFNQQAIKKTLEPRRDELNMLLNNLKSERG